jgi:hypothetical protein
MLALREELSGAGMIFIGVRSAETELEIALITVFAADGAEEQKCMQEVLLQSFSSRSVKGGTATVGTNMRFTEGRHGPLLPF